MPRYLIMSAKEAKEAGITEPLYGDDWDSVIADGWNFSRYVVDTFTKTVIGSDGGEPEDQTLSRDWCWVVEALNRAYESGRSGDL